MKLSKNVLRTFNNLSVCVGCVLFILCMVFSPAPFYERLLQNLILLEGVCIGSLLLELCIKAQREDKPAESKQ